MSEELFKACINELKKEVCHKSNFPINNHLNIRSVYEGDETLRLVITYSTVYEGKIIPFQFYFEGGIKEFIRMCDHEGGYNRFEGYVSSKLRELGNKLIEDSNQIIKEGF